MTVSYAFPTQLRAVYLELSQVVENLFQATL